MRAPEALEPARRPAEGDANSLGRLVTLQPRRVHGLVGARPDVEAGRARRDDQRLAGRDRGRRLPRGALEPSHLAGAGRDADGHVPAPDVVAQPAVQRLLVDRLPGEDRPHRLRAQVGGAAHHSLALGPVLLDEHVADAVDVGEDQRRADVLCRDELLGIVDALLQRPHPAVPQPGMPEPVAAQLSGQRDAAAHIAAHEARRLRRQRHLVDAGAALEQPEHLADVRLRAGHELRHDLLVIECRQLRDGRVEVLGHLARELRRRSAAAPRPAPGRPTLAR